MSTAVANGRPVHRHGLLLATVVALVAALFMGLAADADAAKKKKPPSRVGPVTSAS